MPFLKQMIAELDRPDDYLQPQSRSLKYVLAGDILPALAAALAQGKDEEDQAKSAASNSSSGANGQNSNPVQSLNAASASSSNGQPGLANGTGAGTSEEPALSDPRKTTSPPLSRSARRDCWPIIGPTPSLCLERPTSWIASTR